MAWSGMLCYAVVYGADGSLFGLETYGQAHDECKTRFTKEVTGLWNGVRVRVPYPIEHALVSSYGRCSFG